jgi:hypothetical protein
LLQGVIGINAINQFGSLVLGEILRFSRWVDLGGGVSFAHAQSHGSGAADT